MFADIIFRVDYYMMDVLLLYLLDLIIAALANSVYLNLRLFHWHFLPAQQLSFPHYDLLAFLYTCLFKFV